MPDRVTRRAALVLIALAFGLAFAVQAFAGSSPAPKRATTTPVTTNEPGPEADLSLAAATRVPALRDPIKPKPKPKPKPRKKPRPAPKPAPRTAPTAPMMAAPTPQPTPVATPRYVPTRVPTPRYVPPRRTPAPRSTPAPTPPEPSGDFDTTGDP